MKKGIKIAVDVLLWIFLIFAFLMTVVAFSAQASHNGIPEFGGKCLLNVQSDSMEGENGFYKGDMIMGRVLGDA